MFKDWEEAASYCKETGIEIIDFKIVDIAGRWHHLSIPRERFGKRVLSEGIGFDGSSYGFLTVEKSDRVFIPDISTAFVDPFSDGKTLVMIADIYRLENGERVRFEDDPRFVAEKTEKLLDRKGISDSVLLGPEFEFYVLDRIAFRNETNHMELFIDASQGEWNSGRKEGNIGITVPGHGGYHLDSPLDSSYGFRNDVVRLLEMNNVPVKYHHSENGGPGQVEIEVNFATPLEMGDRTQKLKYILRNEAFRQNRTVTFMPKPFAYECGNGMHVHVQMYNKGNPIFFDKDGYDQLSQTAMYAIGGILKHAPAIMPFTNPSTNSYKRLVPGYEAPVSICFGKANRSAVIRIPGYATAPDQKRFELRSPDATANPYLAYSAIVLAAADGIEKRVDPTVHGFGPIDKNLYKMSEEEKKQIKGLPADLLEAARALEEDHEFLTSEGVFSENLIRNQIRKIEEDHMQMSMLPHPEEFRKYYNL